MDEQTANTKQMTETTSLMSWREHKISCIRSPVVMMVDDQRIFAESVRRMLEPEIDIDFHYCSDPTRAIDMAAEVQPTVILQDLRMPEIDGLTLVRFFRANPATELVPVIVLSSEQEAQEKSKAFSAGASDYLVKLPDRVELVARIRAHSKNYLTHLERDEAYRKLHELQKKLEQQNIELQRLSNLDGLTGIANRRRFDEAMQVEWLRAARKQTMLSLILIDIDNFKAYNDNYGHQAGDDCLRKVAQALSTQFRRPTDLLARYGGEEFVALLPDTLLSGATKLALELNEHINRINIPHQFSDVADHVTISLGVSCCQPGSGDHNATALIDAADMALYQAKRAGRNQVAINQECVPRLRAKDTG